MPTVIPSGDGPRDTLCVPDEHYFKGDNFRRAHWLGNFIVHEQPQVIVRLGDIWDMPSLCSYDSGRREMVFRNVKDDIEAGHEAESYIFGPMLEMNKNLRKAKKAQYEPIVVKLIGNHENRVQRLLDYEAKWSGSISMDEFKTRQPISEVVIPFMDYVEIDGVYYSHYWVSGVQGRPASSAKVMIQKKGVSVSAGHSHFLEHAISTRPDGSLIRGLIAGCYQDIDNKGFGGAQVDAVYWKGLIMKRSVWKGSYDLEEWSIERLMNQDYNKHIR